MALTRALATNNYGPAKFIVSNESTAVGTHSTLALAMASAVSGDTIFIRASATPYTENVTLTPGVNISAYGSDSSLNGTGRAVIAGTLTMTGAGSVTISGIQLQTNSAALLAVTGTLASVVNLQNCYLNMTNNTGITFSTSSASAAINIWNCQGNLGTTGIGIFAHSSAGLLFFQNCFITNTGGSSTANTVSAGTLTLFYSVIFNPITSSGTATFGMSYSGIDTLAQNATSATAGGSGAHNFNESSYTSGTASAISISNTTSVSQCYIFSSNTNAITGAGIILYNGLIFVGTSQKINTTTQTGGLLKGGQTQTPSAGFIGEQITSGLVTGVNLPIAGTQANITSISVTAGIWDITGFGYYHSTVGLNYCHLSISSVSATATGNYGDSENFTQSTFTDLSLVVPNFRVVLTAASTTYYLVAYCVTAGGTTTAQGRISAVRVG